MAQYPVLTTRMSQKVELRDACCGQERRGTANTAMNTNVSQRENATDCDEEHLELPRCTPDAHGSVVVMR